jgi:hypothetical protein
MSGTNESLTNIAGELVAQKGAAAKLNYTLDFSSDLEAGASITNSVWTEASGTLTLSDNGLTAGTVTITVAGGSPGSWYLLENVTTDSEGFVHTSSIRLFVNDGATIGTGLNLPFPSIPGALASIRRDRLASLIATYMSGQNIEDAYLLEKLVAATALIQRKLRTHFAPTEMLPNTASQAEIDALTAAGNTVELEPAYDYDPQIFVGNTWGRTLTRQRPIIAVHSMTFNYPTPNNTLFTIPIDWVRLDKKYGVINLLPTQNATMLPLNAFILSALGGGRSVPQFIEIRYRTGLENVARDYPDVLDVIKKQTVLAIAEDLFVPSSRSESTSADGLSQSASIGFKIDDYSDLIDKKVESIRQSLFGIRAFAV